LAVLEYIRTVHHMKETGDSSYANNSNLYPILRKLLELCITSYSYVKHVFSSFMLLNYLD